MAITADLNVSFTEGHEGVVGDGSGLFNFGDGAGLRLATHVEHTYATKQAYKSILASLVPLSVVVALVIEVAEVVVVVVYLEYLMTLTQLMVMLF